VRSGVLSSVHAFAVDPGRGAYILAFMVTVLTISFGIFLARGGYQEAEEAVTTPLSRESMFIWNNVLFTVGTASVLLGTLYPLALEALSGAKITVGAPYFNKVMVPIFLVVMLLMAIAPLVPWRKANPARLRSRLLIPVSMGLLALMIMLAVARPVQWTAVVGVSLIAFVLGTLTTDLLRAIRQRREQHPGQGFMSATVGTVLGNRRHYGGMLVHFGIAVMAVGLVGSGLFKQEKSVVMSPGEVVEVGGAQLRFEGVVMAQGPNYLARQGRLMLLDSGRYLTPERREYPVQQMPTTEAAIDSTPMRDVYVVLGEPDGAGEDNRWAVHVYFNPLIQFIWLGGAICIGGLALALSFHVRRRSAVMAGETVPVNSK
jgi:cytochrome c-type biogenesis protein CcmF